MPDTTTRLKLPYLLPGDAPDLAGGLYALAAGVEGLFTTLDLTQTAQVYGNWDGAAGMNSISTIGPLRIVHFAMYQDSGYALGDGLFQINTGHKPAGQVWTGGLLADVAVRGSASFSMDSNGYVTLFSYTADSGNDGRIKSLRGTFTYFATH